MGAYFVTVGVAEKACVLGTVVRVDIVLSSLGRIVADQLADLPHRVGADVDCSVVMPNHVHAVVWVREDGPTLGAVVGAFKAGSAREINRARGAVGEPVWQRGYFDHVVRNEIDLERVRDYVATNPLRWSLGGE